MEPEKSLEQKKSLLARSIVFAGAEDSIEKLLAETDVSAEEYADWLCDGEFISQIKALSAHAAEAECARVLRALAELSKSGDPKVVRLYFDLLEEYRERCAQSDSIAQIQKELWGDI